MRINTNKLFRAIKVLRNLRVFDQRKLYILWEQNHLRKIFERFNVDCVFDIGANHGQHAEMLRQRVGFKGLIISFEPGPEAIAVLRRKALNDPLWRIEEMAVSTHDGEQTFNIMNDSEFSSLSSPKNDETTLFNHKNTVKQTFKVKTENLKTALSRLEKEYKFQRPFLKLDTQGFDVEIISAAKDIMQKFIGLQSELAIKRLYQTSVDFRIALDIYESCGFKLSAFIPNNAGHFPVLVETDCIMLRADLLASVK